MSNEPDRSDAELVTQAWRDLHAGLEGKGPAIYVAVTEPWLEDRTPVGRWVTNLGSEEHVKAEILENHQRAAADWPDPSWLILNARNFGPWEIGPHTPIDRIIKVVQAWNVGLQEAIFPWVLINEDKVDQFEDGEALAEHVTEQLHGIYQSEDQFIDELFESNGEGWQIPKALIPYADIDYHVAWASFSPEYGVVNYDSQLFMFLIS